MTRKKRLARILVRIIDQLPVPWPLQRYLARRSIGGFFTVTRGFGGTIIIGPYSNPPAAPNVDFEILEIDFVVFDTKIHYAWRVPRNAIAPNGERPG